MKKAMIIVLIAIILLALVSCRGTSEENRSSADASETVQKTGEADPAKEKAAGKQEAGAEVKQEKPTKEKEPDSTAVPVPTKPEETHQKPEAKNNNEVLKPERADNKSETVKPSKPAKPEPTPQPTKPKPEPDLPKPESDPEPEPKPEPPKPEPIVIDLNALCAYATDYAVSTYGYEYSPGMRDGFYPAYTCYISSMEEGQKKIRECIDDMTADLEARGEPIIAHIDGVAYRMPIDIEIDPDPDGYENSYQIQLYY